MFEEIPGYNCQTRGASSRGDISTTMIDGDSLTARWSRIDNIQAEGDIEPARPFAAVSLDGFGRKADSCDFGGDLGDLKPSGCLRNLHAIKIDWLPRDQSLIALRTLHSLRERLLGSLARGARWPKRIV